MLISLRPVTVADKLFLSWLEEACMREYAQALWGVWNPSSNVECSLEGRCVIVEDGENVGCISVVQYPDHIWIDELYVSPDRQNRSIGTVVLRMVLAQAKTECKPLRLSVLSTNPEIAFYLRHGFTIYNKTTERTYLMAW